MRRSTGVKPYLLPMPVYMVATYDENGQPDVMPITWGGVVGGGYTELNLENDHQTLDNLRKNKAFTISAPLSRDFKAVDYCGIVSATLEPEKFERSGFHAIPSDKVYAPLIEEFPAALECEVVSITKEPYGFRVLGKIVDSKVDENLSSFLEEGLIAYDPVKQQYLQVSGVLGPAFESGFSRMIRRKPLNTKEDKQ